MKFLTVLSVVVLALLFPLSNFSQTDEVREATGLPIQIGQPVIYGQIAIEGLARNERKPLIFVSLVISGTQVDRRQTDDRGYYFFMEAPRHGHMLVVEVDGSEVGRAYLTIGSGNRLRQDLTLDARAIRGTTKARTGVISADGYDRSPENQKLFDQAMSSIRDSKTESATKLFREIVEKDAKDHLAWTMLGTIYYSDKKYPDATQCLTKALELKPEFPPALINFGKVELAQNNLDKAIELLLRAVKAQPTSADANHSLGEAYLQAKKGSLAVGYLNKAIEIAPVEKASIHLRLAALYNAAGIKGRAASEYKAFLEKVKDHPDTKKFEQYIKDNPPTQ